MKNLDEALQELEEIINQQLDKHVIPVKAGNTIRIGPMIIRKSKSAGYIVIDSKKSKQVENTFSKPAAIAVAKSYLKNRNYNRVLAYDTLLQKNYNDIAFYYNIISNSSDDSRKESITHRLEIAHDKIDSATDFLEEYIMRDM
jgi:hypothetical protein